MAQQSPPARSGIGINPGSSGTATVTGAGSTLLATTLLFIGYGSDGVMTIADGATVTVQNAALPDPLVGLVAGATYIGGAPSATSSTGTLALNGTAGARGTLSTYQVIHGMERRASPSTAGC